MVIGALSAWCFLRLTEIDGIWDEYRTRIATGTL
jgi:hypothetical protein